MSSNIFCKMPFYFVEIFPNGDVFPCCPAYCNSYSFGNIYKQSFKDIWNGEKAQNFRKTMYENRPRYCNIKTCFRKSMDYLQNKECIEEKIIMDKFPLAVKFSHDGECNYRCITCRDTLAKNSKDEIITLNKRIDTYFMQLLKDAKIVCLLGSGDPLASKHSRHLIRRISKEYTKIRFGLHTNGSLCTEPLLKSLGILNRLDHIQVSVHASCKQSYEKITREGIWKKILQNLEWIGKQHDLGLIKKFDMIFVVTPLNVQEITTFSHLAKNFGAEAYFWEYRYWGGEFGINFDAVNILSPKHVAHKVLLTQLHNVYQDEHVYLSPKLMHIAINYNKYHSFYKLFSFFIDGLRGQR